MKQKTGKKQRKINENKNGFLAKNNKIDKPSVRMAIKKIKRRKGKKQQYQK